MWYIIIIMYLFDFEYMKMYAWALECVIIGIHIEYNSGDEDRIVEFIMEFKHWSRERKVEHCMFTV